jgi:hypothetical protein
MKTQTNISKLKKISLIFSIVLTQVSFFELHATGGTSDASAINLEIFMKTQEQMLKYSASSVYEEAAMALDRLNALDAVCEESLKYVAPANDEVLLSLERLDQFVSESAFSLKYVAPSLKETGIEIERLDVTVDADIASLKYTAPVNPMEPDVNNESEYSNLMAETK